MKKMKIGVLCPSEIAFRRFMPAVLESDIFEYAGVGVCTKEERFGDKLPSVQEAESILESENEKAKAFVDTYGGEIFDGYEATIQSDKIEAVYIPLPPALHFYWAKKALEAGKHVLVEKPSTTSLQDSKDLVETAKKAGLALHENYMFVFHEQIKVIEELVQKGEIGDVRLYSIKFGFPRRAANDFRYNKILGGGALIDAGGYTIKYANMLLGETAKIVNSQRNYIDGFEVDMYGTATMVNEQGVVAQIAFGMDNNYKCEVEIWGSKGCLKTARIFTAPAGFEPELLIQKGNEEKTIKLPIDDTFKRSIQYFGECIRDSKTREKSYHAIINQATKIEEFVRGAV